MILKRLILIFTIIFTAVACNKLKGPEKPKNLISKGMMVKILIDSKLITSASSKNKIIMRDSSLNSNDYIYEKYKIDSLQFALSNNYYAFHIDEYEDIYTRVSDSLEALKAQLKEQEAEEWKEQIAIESDSLAQMSKEKKLYKDSLKLKNIILKDTSKLESKFLKESLLELEDLIEPVSN